MKAKDTILFRPLLLAAISLFIVAASFAQGGRPPDRESAWFGGQVYSFNAADWLPQKAPTAAQSNIFVVVYPIGWETMGLTAPQCDPCDHAGNGVGFDDFHDHVLDSISGTAGWGPMRRVNVILPNYSFLSGGNDPVRDSIISTAYASHLPATSAEAVNTLLNSTAPDGSPLAIRIDAGFYVRVAVTGGPQ